MRYLIYVAVVALLFFAGCEEKQPCGPNGCPIQQTPEPSEPSLEQSE